jgi:phosphopantetheine--protein transferase-like protein
MGVVGIGVDALQLSRLHRLLLQRPQNTAKLASRILSPIERVYWQKLRNPSSFPAAVFDTRAADATGKAFSSPLPNHGSAMNASDKVPSTISPTDTTAMEADKEVLMYLATRWAVKEAAYKAIGWQCQQCTWKQWSLVRASATSSRPILLLDPTLQPTTSQNHGSRFVDEEQLKNLQKPWKAHVSISHDGDYVMANVLVEST